MKRFFQLLTLALAVAALAQTVVAASSPEKSSNSGGSKDRHDPGI